MTIATIVIVFGVAALAVLFFLARRMLRLAVRLALGLLLALILVAGGLYWWWTHSGSLVEQNSNRATVSPTRRSTSNR